MLKSKINFLIIWCGA